MQNYPFKFLDSYTREDKDIFFGRNQEIDQLYEMVFKSKLIFVYGSSGTGKTSLIQCGLANKFKDYYWKPLNIRRGNHINWSLDKALCEASDGVFEYRAKNEITDLAQKIEAVYLASFRPVYLVFDQLEELYILGQKEEQQAFAQAIKEILAVEQPVKMLFSIREEYWGYLYELEKVVPELLRSKLRVELMTDSRLKEVVSKTCQKGGIELENSKDAEGKDLIDHILNAIRSKQRASVSLPYLQVYLDKLYRKAQGKSEKVVFSPQLVQDTGQIQDVLEDFLKEQIEETDKKFEEKDLCRKILNEFLSSEGTKRPCEWEYIREKTRNLVNAEKLQAILLHLTNVRILKGEEKQYELAHDSLAEAINRLRTAEEKAIADIHKLLHESLQNYQRNRSLLTAENLNYILKNPYFEKIKLETSEKELLDKSKAKVRREKIRLYAFVSSLAILTLFAVGFGWFAIEQKNEADSAKNEAQSLLTENVRKDSLNRIEKYNRYIAEAKSLENNTEYSKAIEKYYIAKDFAKDTLSINQAIDRCENAEGNAKKMDGYLREAQEQAKAENYPKALDAYQKAAALDIKKALLREKLNDFLNTLQKEYTSQKEVIEAMRSANPQSIAKEKAKAQELNQFITQTQTLLKQLSQ
jgi:hypothetical protein